MRFPPFALSMAVPWTLLGVGAILLGASKWAGNELLMIVLLGSVLLLALRLLFREHETRERDHRESLISAVQKSNKDVLDRVMTVGQGFDQVYAQERAERRQLGNQVSELRDELRKIREEMEKLSGRVGELERCPVALRPATR